MIIFTSVLGDVNAQPGQLELGVVPLDWPVLAMIVRQEEPPSHPGSVLSGHGVLPAVPLAPRLPVAVAGIWKARRPIYLQGPALPPVVQVVPPQLVASEPPPPYPGKVTSSAGTVPSVAPFALPPRACAVWAEAAPPHPGSVLSLGSKADFGPPPRPLMARQQEPAPYPGSVLGGHGAPGKALPPSFAQQLAWSEAPPSHPGGVIHSLGGGLGLSPFTGSLCPYRPGRPDGAASSLSRRPAEGDSYRPARPDTCTA